MAAAPRSDNDTSDGATRAQGTSAPGNAFARPALPAAQALLEVRVESKSSGSACALLTPAIKAKLREMGSGQVLEVRVNDPTAREDIGAWCRLSGNELLAMVDSGNQGLRFFVRKK